MRKIAVAALAALAVWATGCDKKPDAKVDPSGKREARDARWEKADANRDGKLSRAEAALGHTPGLSSNCDKVDTNKDGFLTREEREHFVAVRDGGKK